MTKEQYEKLKEILQQLMLMTSDSYRTKVRARDKAVELEKELDKLMGFE